jgi:hypothetical protein
MERHRVIQAFKMACLHYNPSRVRIEGEEVERADALQIGCKQLKDSLEIMNRIMQIEERFVEEVKPEFMKL